MCAICAGRDYVEHDAHLLLLIKLHGWAIQGVYGDSDDDSYYYTVGLSERGLPELVISGIEQGHSCALLNTLAEYQVDGAELLDGHTASIGRQCMEFSVFDARALVVAQGLYSDRVRALEVRLFNGGYCAEHRKYVNGG